MLELTGKKISWVDLVRDWASRTFEQDEGFKVEYVYNDDGTKRFAFYARKDGDTHHLNISLEAQNIHTGWSDVLRALEVTKGENRFYLVEVDTVAKNLFTTSESYIFKSNQEGLRKKSFSGGLGMDGHTYEECKAHMRLRGHYEEDELPLQINVMQTVQAFVKQLQERNFDTPVLVEFSKGLSVAQPE